MLFKCLPGGRAGPGPLPRPGARPRQMVHDRHPLPRQEREGDAAGRGQRGQVSRWFLETQAGPRSRAVNRANGERTSRAERVARKAHRGHGPDGDRHPGRSRRRRARPITAPTPISGSPTARAVNDFHRRVSAGAIPERFVGLGTVPFQALGARGRRARPAAQIAGLPRHRDHDPRRRRGFVGRPLSARSSPAAKSFGLLGVHAPRRLHRGAAAALEHYFANVIGNPLDSTVALHHLIFGGVLRDYPNLKLVAAAWRGFPAGLFGPHSITPPRRGPIAAKRSRGCRRPI